MAQGTLRAQARKLTEKIDGQDAYVVDLVNDDLDRIDELGDEYAELERLKLDVDVDGCEDAEERKTLRARVRELSRQQRALDTKMLGLYVEGKDGVRFDEDVLAKVPVRVQTALIKQATGLIYGTDEGPTPQTSASG